MFIALKWPNIVALDFLQKALLHWLQDIDEGGQWPP